MADLPLRRFVWIFRLACVVLLALGVALAVETHEEHWVERGGKVVVAMALLLTYFQFRYEVTHAKEEELARHTAAQLLRQKPFVSADQRIEVENKVGTIARTRFDADRAYILVNSLTFAIVGELVSAFGGFALHFRDSEVESRSGENCRCGGR